MDNKLLSLVLLCVCVTLLPKLPQVFAKSAVVELTEDNWRLMLEGEWMVEFFAPWCPACKSLEPTWKSFSAWSEDLNIKVGQVDITTSPGLSGRFIVTALPTIYHVKEGEFRQYKGARDKSSLISYIEDAKWQQTEPLPSWKSPTSFQMGIVANFFKLSQILKGLHTELMETYGIPTWGSYVLFAVTTIIVGAIMGLVLVCIIDFFYPPKTDKSKAGQKEENQEDTSEEEISKEDLIDDNSELEKNSGIDTEEDTSSEKDNEEQNLINQEAGGDSNKSNAVNKKTPNASQNNSPTNSPQTRKRKPRKVD
ncbi:thioredoxin-related transmembrane protein 1 [Ctenocephalides felis]|uniref:thioredoxin-related transmembrane protein 1 n=1 Tax=Ctenocephalides felis TaxID=7515 RepID=UPI000E6E5354|nr:thioredoxin-related transmembrane protein 1 [Ctenocephalides felis]